MELEVAIKYLVAFLSGFITTYMLTPVVRALAHRFQVVDMPDQRRLHAVPTARGGGLALVAGFHAACFFILFLPWSPFDASLGIDWWRSFLFASSILVLFGLADDVRGLNPWIKLAGQTTAATVMYGTGSCVHTMLGIDLPMPLDYALTVLWFLAVTNAFNLIDGLDGLATGLALIAALGMAGALLFRHLPGDALLLIGLAGACLAFLRYNFHPASIFLGDSGSMFLGFTLAAIAIETGGKTTLLASVAMPLLAIGIPIFDTLLAIWRRSLRTLLPAAFPEFKGQAGVMQADAEHLHHRLLKSGMPQRQVALFLHLVGAIAAAVGLLTLMYRERAAGIFLLAFVAGVYVIVRHLARVELWDTGRAIITGLHRPPTRVVAFVLYPVWDLFCLCIALLLTLQLTHSLYEPVAFRLDLLPALPIWVAPTFLTLCLAGVYNRVWSHARFADHLLLVACLVVGALVSLALQDFAAHDLSRNDIGHMVIQVSFAYIALTGTRISFRRMQELMTLLSRQRRPGRSGNSERILLFGAGTRCQLFLEQVEMGLFQQECPRTIIGLVDDDPNLRKRRVFGFKVLGNREDLPQLIHEHEVATVVVTSLLPREGMLQLQLLVEPTNARLVEWVTHEQPVSDATGDRRAPQAAAVARGAETGTGRKEDGEAPPSASPQDLA